MLSHHTLERVHPRPGARWRCRRSARACRGHLYGPRHARRGGQSVTLPPYAQLLGLSVEPGDGGAPVLLMPFSDDVLGRPGFLHGGAIGGLLEMAAIVALHAALESEGGGRIKPINVTVDYMRGGREKETRAQGIVPRLGTRERKSTRLNTSHKCATRMPSSA